MQGGKPISTTCPQCHKREIDAEERREAELKLPGIIEQQREVWRDKCCLTLKFYEKTFENFDQKLQPKAYKVVKDYKGESSILLSSPDIYGVGKTHLLAALVNRIIETSTAVSLGRFSEIRRHACPVYFTTETQLLARIRSTFEDKSEGAETEADIYEQLDFIDLLIIDDVGKVRPRDYSFLQGVYFRIIDARYNSESPIVMTTNLNLVELEAHVGGASADRLREMCGKNIVIMTGKSYRQKAKP